MSKIRRTHIWIRACLAATLILTVGLASCAHTATPPKFADSMSADPSIAVAGPSKILAIRPVSRIGAGGVSGVLLMIGAANAPREAGQEVIVRNTHGRVLSVLRPTE